ncbi:MAG TPA: MmcQ/YjbR family DNA-binding protein [Ignavibacteria bacterium]|nr:MmcQ/YjbR family DNA-binding protein [Ignavibacteria bacterium]
MVSTETFRQIALSFPDTSEKPHFEKTSFRAGKKIFATLDVKNLLGCLKLSGSDQISFSANDKTIIYPVPNKWGLQGWTFVNIKKIRKDIFRNLMKAAYTEVISKK